MKKLIFLFVLVICIGCDEHQICTDNISPYNKKLKYNEGAILTFADSLNNLKYDTVLQVHIQTPDYERYKAAEEDGYGAEYDERSCDATSFVKFSNLFYIYIYKHSIPEIKGLLGYIYPGGYGYWNPQDFTYEYTYDTIQYQYNNKTYEALKYSYYDDTVHSWIWDRQTDLTKQNNYIYHDYTFIYEDDIKLVEYTTRDKTGAKKTWKLKE